MRGTARCREAQLRRYRVLVPKVGTKQARPTVGRAEAMDP